MQAPPEALYVLDHVSYQHLLLYIKPLDSVPSWEQRTMKGCPFV